MCVVGLVGEVDPWLALHILFGGGHRRVERFPELLRAQIPYMVDFHFLPFIDPFPCHPCYVHRAGKTVIANRNRKVFRVYAIAEIPH